MGSFEVAAQPDCALAPRSGARPSTASADACKRGHGRALSRLGWAWARLLLGATCKALSLARRAQLDCDSCATKGTPTSIKVLLPPTAEVVLARASTSKKVKYFSPSGYFWREIGHRGGCPACVSCLYLLVPLPWIGSRGWPGRLFQRGQSGSDKVTFLGGTHRFQGSAYGAKLKLEAWGG